jgi:hypothetical protein
MHELFNSKGLKTFAAILIIFAVGLVGFYIFSAQYGDGLEVTMEDAGVEEAEPVHTSPLNYGDNYLATLTFGIIGFIVTLFAVYLLARLLRKNDA